MNVFGCVYRTQKDAKHFYWINNKAKFYLKKIKTILKQHPVSNYETNITQFLISYWYKYLILK